MDGHAYDDSYESRVDEVKATILSLQNQIKEMELDQREAKIHEAALRCRYPALQDAWDQYLIVRKMVSQDE